MVACMQASTASVAVEGETENGLYTIRMGNQGRSYNPLLNGMYLVASIVNIASAFPTFLIRTVLEESYCREN